MLGEGSGPSLASSVAKTGRPISSSRASPSASPSPAHSYTERFTASTASGAAWLTVSASSSARASAVPSGTTLPTSPMSRASAAL